MPPTLTFRTTAAAAAAILALGLAFGAAAAARRMARVFSEPAGPRGPERRTRGGQIRA